MFRLSPILALAFTLYLSTTPTINAQSNIRNSAAASAAARAAAQHSSQRPQKQSSIRQYQRSKPLPRQSVQTRQVPMSRLGVNKAPSGQKSIKWQPKKMTNAQLKHGVLAKQSKGQSFRLSNGFVSVAHVSRDHIGQTKSQLVSQLSRKKVVSTFHSAKVAERAVTEVLNSSAPRINAWASSAKAGDKKYYTMKGTTNVGFGIKRGEQQVTSGLTKTRVVLRSLGDGRYFILTAYPVLD
jgi:hypothetical protein